MKLGVTRRALQAVLVIACAVALSSCISYRYRRGGSDPTDLVNWTQVIDKARKAGAKQRSSLQSESSFAQLTASDPIVAATQAAFDEVTEARRLLLVREPSGYGGRSAYDKVQGYVWERPTLLVLGTDAPLSVTYPDNTIVIARRLIDGLSVPGDVDNHWALRFVAAHELAHHYDGHAIFNWLTTRGQRGVPARRFLTALTQFTRHGPVSFAYDYQPSETFQNLRRHSTVFEFLADYWSYYTLRDMGAPTGIVSGTLDAVRDATVARETKKGSLRQSVLIRQRARCMGLLDSHGATLPESYRVFPLGPIKVIGTRAAVLAQFEAAQAGAKRSGDAAAEYLIAKHIQRSLSEAGSRAVAPDDLYWSCAFAAMFIEEGDMPKKYVAAHSADDPRQMIANFAALASDPDLALGYPEELDSIPLVRAGETFRRPKPDLRPNLRLDSLRYEGYEQGMHHVTLQVENRGHLPTQAPVILLASIAGSPVPLYRCRPAEDDAAMGSCAGVVWETPFHPGAAVFASRPVDVYFAAAPVLPPGQRKIRFMVDGCEQPRDSGADAAPAVCAVAESNETDNHSEVVFGALPDLIITGYSSNRIKISVNVSNWGHGPVDVPFQITATKRGVAMPLTTCSAEEAGTRPECTGVWVKQRLAPRESVWVDFIAPEAEYGAMEFYVDGCAPTPDAGQGANACAVDEIDERNNSY